MESSRRLWINNGMRMGIQDSKAREQTITVYTDREKFTELTGLTIQKIDALIVDKNRKILWHQEGASTNSSEQDLLEALKAHSKD